jgi:hypothetical protein
MADIKAGGAYVELGIKDTIDRGLKIASGKLKSWGKNVGIAGAAFSAAGAAALAPMTAAALSFTAAGDALNDMASRTGLAVDSLSALSFAANMSGTSLEELEGGLKKMSKVAAESGKTTEQAMMDFADEIAAIENPLQRAARAQEIFGRAGTQLLPMLSEGSAGVRKLMEEANRLGVVMGESDVAAAAEFDDAMNKVKAVLGGVRNVIGAALVPVLTKLADKLTGAIAVIVPFISENRNIVAAVAITATAITGLGIAMTSIGAIVAGLGLALGGITTAITAIGTVAAAVFSPIGILIAGVTAAVVALSGALIYVAWDTGLISKAWEHVGIVFGNVMKIASETLGGIADAISSGDMSLAMQIAMKGLEAAAWRGLHGVWRAFKDMLPKMMETLWAFTKQVAKWALELSLAMVNPIANYKKIYDLTTKGFSFEIGDGIENTLNVNANQAQMDLRKLTDQAAAQRAAREASEAGANAATNAAAGAAPVVGGQAASAAQAVQKDQLSTLEQIEMGIMELVRSDGQQKLAMLG